MGSLSTEPVVLNTCDMSITTISSKSGNPVFSTFSKPALIDDGNMVTLVIDQTKIIKIVRITVQND